MASSVVYNSTEDVDKFRRYTSEVAKHFQSETLAEHYLNGLIDWDGNELCDIHGSGPCRCLDIDW